MDTFRVRVTLHGLDVQESVVVCASFYYQYQASAGMVHRCLYVHDVGVIPLG
jgi:hypothetical protein